MKNAKQPLQVKTTPLFNFEKASSFQPGTTHPTTVTITTSSTGIFLTANQPASNKPGE
ncbi:MAG: hypothetical protein H3C48_09850 [Chitinophagaceae bacterium]|nr:hypothetical protein [Chitinophagaceae bacterium]